MGAAGVEPPGCGMVTDFVSVGVILWCGMLIVGGVMLTWWRG